MTWITLACLLALASSAFGRPTYGNQLWQINLSNDYEVLGQASDAESFVSQFDLDEVPVLTEAGPLEDICASQPCLNGGQCLQIDSSYQCQCAPGFDGSNCELDAHVCQTEQPCGQSPDARCQSFRPNTALSYICTFQYGLVYGFNAEQVKPNPCHGVDGIQTLLVSEKGFIMCEGENMSIGSCPGGTVWSDIHKACIWPDMKNYVELDQQQILAIPELSPLKDVCASQPCLNGGQCLQTDSSYQCQCASGFDGSNCELDTHVCQTEQPCGQSPDARCQSFRPNAALSYICTFQYGLVYGFNAEEAKPNPCQGIDGIQTLLVSEKGFIMCDGENMFIESCPGGTLWSDINKTCVWPDIPNDVQLDQEPVYEEPPMISESVNDI